MIFGIHIFLCYSSPSWTTHSHSDSEPTKHMMCHSILLEKAQKDDGCRFLIMGFILWFWLFWLSVSSLTLVVSHLLLHCFYRHILQLRLHIGLSFRLNHTYKFYIYLVTLISWEKEGELNSFRGLLKMLLHRIFIMTTTFPTVEMMREELLGNLLITQN